LKLLAKKSKLIHLLTELKTISLSLILIDTTAKETTEAVKKGSLNPSFQAIEKHPSLVMRWWFLG
jgi:hypothetical protein